MIYRNQSLILWNRDFSLLGVKMDAKVKYAVERFRQLPLDEQIEFMEESIRLRGETPSAVALLEELRKEKAVRK